MALVDSNPGTELNTELSEADGEFDQRQEKEGGSLLDFFDDLEVDEKAPKKAKSKRPSRVEEEESAEDEEDGEEEDSSHSDVEDDAEDEDETAEEGEGEGEAEELYSVQDGAYSDKVTLQEALNGYMRTANYTRKTQELAKERNELAAKVQKVQEAYDSAISQLDVLEQFVNPEPPDFSALAQSDPDALPDAVRNWEQRKQALAQIKAKRTEALEKQQTAAKAAREEYERNEAKALMQKIPQLADKVKGPKLKTALFDFAESELGVTPEELEKVTDHRVWLAINLARQGFEARVKASLLKQKEPTNTKTPTLKPGPRKPAKQADRSSRKRRMEMLTNRLKESGDKQVGRALLMELDDLD